MGYPPETEIWLRRVNLKNCTNGLTLSGLTLLLNESALLVTFQVPSLKNDRLCLFFRYMRSRRWQENFALSFKIFTDILSCLPHKYDYMFTVSAKWMSVAGAEALRILFACIDGFCIFFRETPPLCSIINSMYITAQFNTTFYYVITVKRLLNL